mgnify:CR=1 FL=1
MSLPSLLSSARALAITTLALTLSGCFDIEQSLRVRGDTFTYEAFVRIDARLVAMAEGKDKINCEKFKITQPPGALQVKIRSSEKNDGTNLVCQLAIEGPVSAAALADFPAKLELAPRSDDHPVFGKNGGMGFASDALYNFDSVKGEFRATVVRASRYANDVETPATAEPWRPAVDCGELKFRFLITGAKADLPRLAAELEQTPVVQIGRAHV